MATFGPVTHWCREATWQNVHSAILGLFAGILVTLWFPPLGVLVLFSCAIALSLSWQKPRLRARRSSIEVKDGTLFLDRWPTVKKAVRVAITANGEVHQVQVFDGAAYPRVIVTTYSEDEAERLREALMPSEVAEAPVERAERSPTELLLARGSRTETEWRIGLSRLSEAGYRGTTLERERLVEVLEDSSADESAREGAAILLRQRE